MNCIKKVPKSRGVHRLKVRIKIGIPLEAFFFVSKDFQKCSEKHIRVREKV
jgi:hypothetical protein